MQCTNKLKQIGLAVHNFHDTLNAMPPSNVADENRATFWGMLYPYIEQQALYEALKEPYKYQGGYVVRYDWWYDIRKDPSDPPMLSEEQRKGFGSFGGYQCPSRRSGYSANDYSSTSYSSDANAANAPGPQGDYAIIMSARSVSWFGNKENNSPFRTATYKLASTAGSQLTWTARDSFARCEDGLSNQFFVGEKHIPIGRVGICPNLAAATPSSTAMLRNNGDCSYLIGYGQGRIVSGARTLASYEGYASGSWGTSATNGMREYLICVPSDYSDDTTPAPNPYYGPLRALGFGSWHPGVCNFLLGDGSVRGVSVTTATQILRLYSFVDDGEHTALP